jgi:hypothetical protein
VTGQDNEPEVDPMVARVRGRVRRRIRRDRALGVIVLIGLFLVLLASLAYLGIDVWLAVQVVAAAIRGEFPWLLALAAVAVLGGIWWFVLGWPWRSGG